MISGVGFDGLFDVKDVHSCSDYGDMSTAEFYANYERVVREHRAKRFASFKERLDAEVTMVDIDHWCGQVDVAETRGRETYNALRNNFEARWQILKAVRS